MSADDDAVVRAAFSLLHQAIPKLQEDLSMELALEKQAIHLPGDLLAMIVDARSDRRQTHALRKYFLCWKLIFDHFPKASHKLREAYINDLKEGDQLSSLLSAICDQVRITSGRPVDASRFEFEEFNTGHEEVQEKALQQLSVHLYYCALLYIPGLVKNGILSRRTASKDHWKRGPRDTSLHRSWQHHWLL